MKRKRAEPGFHPFKFLIEIPPQFGRCFVSPLDKALAEIVPNRKSKVRTVHDRTGMRHFIARHIHNHLHDRNSVGDKL